MTEEQIKQNAEQYAINGNTRGSLSLEILYQNTRDAFIAGAHSRDEEIEELNGQVTLHKDRADYYHDLYMKLRNPWISVEDRLPEEGKDILLSHNDGTIVRLGCVRIGDVNFIKNHIQCYMCWMETPKPELKKGE